jgi:hypothetical protein
VLTSSRFGKKGVSISLVKINDQCDIKNLLRIKQMPNDIEKYL